MEETIVLCKLTGRNTLLNSVGFIAPVLYWAICNAYFHCCV